MPSATACISTRCSAAALPRKPGLYRRVGLACGLDVMKAKPDEADRRTIDFLRHFLVDLGLGDGLRAHGVKDANLPALTEQAFADPCHLTNPVPIHRDDLRALYQAAL